MFIPGCQCCGGSTTAGCSCACASGNQIPSVLNFTVSSGTPTATGGLTSDQLAKVRRLIDGHFCATTGGSDCSPSWAGTIVPTNPPPITHYDQGGIGFTISATGSDPCARWRVIASTNILTYGEGLDGMGSRGTAIYVTGVGLVSVTAESYTDESIKQVYGLCGLTAQTTLTGFLSQSGSYLRATVTLDGGGTATVEFGNATITASKGCPICACNAPCSKSATLNGVTYDCLPPEITMDLSVVRVEGYFADDGDNHPGVNFTVAVISAINELPAMTVPLVAWNGNAATYRYDYPVGTNDTYMRYEATLYCSSVCQPSNNDFNTACVRAFLINKSTATPTPLPSWPITAFTSGGGGVSFSNTINGFQMWYTDNWADGDQVPAPTLTINSTCSAGSRFSNYDASGAQDLGGSNVSAGPFQNHGYPISSQSVYITEGKITLSVPV